VKVWSALSVNMSDNRRDEILFDNTSRDSGGESSNDEFGGDYFNDSDSMEVPDTARSAMVSVQHADDVSSIGNGTTSTDPNRPHRNGALGTVSEGRLLESKVDGSNRPSSERKVLISAEGKRLVRKVRRRPKPPGTPMPGVSDAVVPGTTAERYKRKNSDDEGPVASPVGDFQFEDGGNSQDFTLISRPKPRRRRPSNGVRYMPESIPLPPPSPHRVRNRLSAEAMQPNHAGRVVDSMDELRTSYHHSNSLTPIDFLQDDRPEHMTWSRRIALYLSRRYSWYNPRLQIQQQEEHFQQTAKAVGIDIKDVCGK
jgi:hypothetical protein